ncbi:hypothetical protein BKA65DRAFT_498580 [Rhexocercosporidium sp. MPI-PUGE-AT-0058]|nr:hypothetical protein BKA65DRAFT_498580 [Rhexocercosporidium sp. MPI-PUGE-AT-0058]
MVQGVKRKYRTDSSEPGQQSGSVMIERYLAGKDPFRVAPPQEIPTPWPYVQCAITPDADNVLRIIMSDCEKICEDHFITIRDINVIVLMRKDWEDQGTPCLIIETRDVDTTRWQAAAADLRDLVQKTKPKNDEAFKVEIRNSSRMYSDVSSCLSNDPDLDRYLDEVQPKIVTMVKEKLRSSWTSIAFHMRGPRSRENPSPPKPTVLIFVKPNTSYFFDEVETRLVEILNSPNFPNSSINTEILVGTVSYAVRTASDPKSFSHITSTRPYNGMSIGARNLTQETGSLGGWVRLTSKINPTESMDYVLSAYHVFEKADEEGELDNDVSGIGFYGANLVPDIEVVWPSNLDEQYTRSLCEKKISQGTTRQEFATALSILNQIRGAGRSIGKLRYASGHATRSPTNRRLDWALIPSPNTTQRNRPPQVTIYGNKYLEGTYSPKADDYIRKFGPEMQQYSWVVRSGRTSTRQGFVNRRDRVVRWENTAKHEHSNEMEILPIGGEADFCDAGDSGSWVINENFELVAMLVGKCDGSFENEGIATPIKDLIEDIERRTNCTVSLP